MTLLMITSFVMLMIGGFPHDVDDDNFPHGVDDGFPHDVDDEFSCDVDDSLFLKKIITSSSSINAL